MTAFVFRFRGFHGAVSAMLICWIGFSASVRAQSLGDAVSSDTLPSGAREWLQKNAAFISSVHLEYKYDRGHGSSAEDHTAYLDMRRYYVRTEKHRLLRDGNAYKQVHEVAFDGKTFYIGDNNKSDVWSLTEYSIGDATDPQRDMEFLDIPYFNAAGFYYPRSVAALASSPSIDSLLLHELAQSTSTRAEPVGDKLRITVKIPDPILVRARDTDLVQVRKQLESTRNPPKMIAEEIEQLTVVRQLEPVKTVAFLLDPNFHYGVVARDEWSAAGKRILHVATDGWKHYEGVDIWLPDRSVDSRYYKGGYVEGYMQFTDQPVTILTTQLTLAKFGAAEKVRFALNYKKPGSMVFDRTSAEAQAKPFHQVEYTVAADGVTLRRSAQDAVGDIQGPGAIWIWINVAIVAVILIAYFARRAVRAWSK